MPAATRDEFTKLIARAAQDGWAVVGLPAQMPENGGRFECTIAWDDEELGAEATDYRFSWSGGPDYVEDNTLSFDCVIAQANPGLSVMSSVGMRGVAHWLDSGQLLVTWWSTDGSQWHGWGVAPDAVTLEDESELQDPNWWARLLVEIDKTMTRAGSFSSRVDESEADGNTYGSLS